MACAIHSSASGPRYCLEVGSKVLMPHQSCMTLGGLAHKSSVVPCGAAGSVCLGYLAAVQHASLLK